MKTQALANPPPEWSQPGSWLREFLKRELASYPGRVALVARMVLAATAAMLAVMTFRLPYGAYPGFLALILSREDPDATLKDIRTSIVAFAFSTTFVVIGAMIFAGDPMVRLLWVIAALFGAFFALSAMSNYLAAFRSGWLVVIMIPVWDQHEGVESRLEQTLWIVAGLVLAQAITAGIELVFAACYPSEDLLEALERRFTAIQQLLTAIAEDRRVEKQTEEGLTLLAMLGTSRLRRVLQRSATSQSYGEQMGAVVALVGRLVDLSVTLVQLNPEFSAEAREHCRSLARDLGTIQADLLAGRSPRLPGADEQSAPAPTSTPLLAELQVTVSWIPQIFAGSESLSAYAPSSESREPEQRIFAADAFTNPEHLRFALRGCLAASLCYIIYMSLDWPGISTAVTTCYLTALSTIGSSRQKQVLRVTGALAGGALGMFSQMFILPGIDSIAGFTLLFLAVTCLGAWIMSSGPRLSYFGLQLLVAFYLINISEFTIQTSLTIARDRVIGILAGLVVMWLAFDGIGGARAIVGMKKTLISLLRSLAKLARDPVAPELQAAINESYAVRETVNKSLNDLRAFGDGVLFEFGRMRERDLALQSRFLSWQPQLRLLFLTRVTLFKYRLQLPGFELPEELRQAQRHFDASLAKTLDWMADNLEGKANAAGEDLQIAFARLSDLIHASTAAAGQGLPAQSARTFGTLSERITSLAVTLVRKIHSADEMCPTESTPCQAGLIH